MIRTVGLALAFSPTAEMMLAEAVAVAGMFRARLVLIHAGNHTRKEEQLLESLLLRRGVEPSQVTVRWELGSPVRAILRACAEEGVDLLVAGALQRENLLQHYIGTIARQIMRKASCSVLILTNPSLTPHGFRNLVVESSDHQPEALELALRMGTSPDGEPCWLNVVREVKMYGLALASSDQSTEEEYEKIRQDLVQEEILKAEKQLRFVPRSKVKVNIKVLSGKSGFELVQFTRRRKADLLVVPAPERQFSILDRIFTHDIEYVFADLPCNLLIIQPQKHTGRA